MTQVFSSLYSSVFFFSFCFQTANLKYDIYPDSFSNYGFISMLMLSILCVVLNQPGLVRTSVAFCHCPVFKFMTLSYNYSLSMEHFWARLPHTHFLCQSLSLLLVENACGKSLWVGWRFIGNLIIIFILFFNGLSRVSLHENLFYMPSDYEDHVTHSFRLCFI